MNGCHGGLMLLVQVRRSWHFSPGAGVKIFMWALPGCIDLWDKAG